MGRLTKKEASGKWQVNGISWKKLLGLTESQNMEK